jgi:hypothetical protein
METSEDLLMIGPAAKRAGLSVAGLRWLANMNRVPCMLAGRIRLFKARDMDKLKRERTKRKARKGSKP